MEGNSLKGRAIAFAFCVGAASFILALFAGLGKGGGAGGFATAVIVAIICSVMSWGSAERALAGVAEAIDAAIDRVTRAAEGDLLSPTPKAVGEALPELSRSLDGLLAQVRTNLDSVHMLAMFDPVTALANRTNFRREAGNAIDAVPEGTISALLFIDLDRFKAVNDSMGHAQGDQLLAKVANRLRAAVSADVSGRPRFRREALIGRLAGDEFTILLPEVASSTQAEELARDLLSAITEPFDLAGQQVEIGASIGIALRPYHANGLSELMRAADAAMYRAKDDGRRRWQTFCADIADELDRDQQLERELRRALDHREFALVFQPQIDLATGKPRTAEALLRWEHPTRGTQLPTSFVARAEETGLIGEIGDWVVEEAASTLARWARGGDDRKLAINVSPRQVCRLEFFTALRAALVRHDAPADRLEIEITETTAMACSAAMLDELKRLRADGVTIAVDDFGTGYSNLARLREMPVDRVKIDQSLIADIATSERARTLVHSVIGLVHGMGFKAVAEGVETREQQEVLSIIGCDTIQGYAIAHPMHEAELDRWLASRVSRAA